MSDAIILFAHGSLLCGAGETLHCLAEYMQSRGDAPLVEPGYLNYSEPKFEETVAKCVAAGAQRIVVAPYFLVAGKFVQVDLKPKIEIAREKYPQVEFHLAQAMKDHPALADALVVIPAAQKTDHGSSLSRQYSGSLFEQALFLATESVFQSLWDTTDEPAEQLWLRHANLE